MEKRILFIAPDFFGYYKIIKNELGINGYMVDTFLYPRGFVYKLLEFKFRKTILYKRYCKNYYNSLKNRFANEYDIVYIIKASKLPSDFLAYLKERFSNARFIQYLWDDIALDPDSLRTLPFFDKVLSFNKYDCMANGFMWRPFFYQKDYSREKMCKEIDLFYIASYNNSRFNFVRKILSMEGIEKLNVKIILKSSIFLFLTNIQNFNYCRYFSTKGLKYGDMIDTLKKSTCSIEMPYIGQIGLTTRPFECLSTRTKVVTTNRDIVNYDFYHENNVLVVDSDNPHIPIEWIRKEYQEIPQDIVDFYSINKFIKDTLS